MEPPPLRKNIISNLLGRGWSSLLNIALVPVYIRFMGIESYGLVGVFVALQNLINLFDIGLPTSLNRELAQHYWEPEYRKRVGDIVRTFEIVYWLISVVIFLSIYLWGPKIANDWLNPTDLDKKTVENSVALVSIPLVLRFLSLLYSAGLMGLEQQVILNKINILVGTVRGIGAVFVLWLIEPTVKSFFIWHSLISVLELFLLMYVFWRMIPTSFADAKFERRVLGQTFRFSFAMTLVTLSNVLTTQVDKLILSRMVSLQDFGYYTFAVTVAYGLFNLSYPVANATFPRFSYLARSGAEAEMTKVYHGASQVVSVLVIPTAVVVVLFSPQLLILWTNDTELTRNVSTLLSLVVIGVMFQCFSHVPYVLQLAQGWTSHWFYYNMISLAFLVPAFLLLVPIYGAYGAALTWIALTLGYILFGMPVMHSKLLKGELLNWYRKDVGLPLMGGAVSGLICYYFFDGFQDAVLPILMVASLITFTSVLLSSSLARHLFVVKIRSLMTP